MADSVRKFDPRQLAFTGPSSSNYSNIDPTPLDFLMKTWLLIKLERLDEAKVALKSITTISLEQLLKRMCGECYLGGLDSHLSKVLTLKPSHLPDSLWVSNN